MFINKINENICLHYIKLISSLQNEIDHHSTERQVLTRALSFACRDDVESFTRAYEYGKARVAGRSLQNNHRRSNSNRQDVVSISK